MGWGDLFGIINKFVPDRKEVYRNRIEKIKREMNEILKEDDDKRNVVKYEHLSEQLRELETKIQNATG